MTIQPTAVYPPTRSASPPATTGGQRFYQTYNTRYVSQPSGGPGPAGGSSAGIPSGGGRFYNYWNRIPQGSLKVKTPSGVPNFLGARPVILFMWIAAMGMVSWDEWRNYHVLPRPARLWYTTSTYFLLALLASFDAMVPLANGLAIGFTISVAYNYYTGAGGFGTQGAAEQVTSQQPGGTNAPSTATAPTGTSSAAFNS